MIKLPRVLINLEKIVQNYLTLNRRAAQAGIRLTGVVKGAAGNPRIARALVEAGLKEIGDSRLENFRKMGDFSQTKKILLRLPGITQVSEVISLTNLSLHSEPEVLRLLNESARAAGVDHEVFLMVDLGDLREGVSSEALPELGAYCRKLSKIRVVGLGTNFSCFAGAAPSVEKLKKLVLLAEMLRHEMGLPIEVLSGGNSSSLPMLYQRTIPSGINHLRIGEGILLGRETFTGSFLPDLQRDTFILEGEAIQVQRKPGKPDGEVRFDAFGRVPDLPVTYEGIRVLLNIGHQDAPLAGLTPIDPAFKVLGGSSDYLVLASERMVKVGEFIQFLPNYWSVLGLMTSPYVGKVYAGEC